MSDDDEEERRRRNAELLRRQNLGVIGRFFEDAGNWLAACWRRITG